MSGSSGGRDGRMAHSPTHSGTHYIASGYSSMQSPQSGEKLSKTNLYIRGLTSNTTDDDLVVMCQQ